jgi:hypothetical protein
MKTKTKTNERFHIPDPDADPPVFSTVEIVAKRWNCGVDKAASILEQHRGEPGFMDLGSHADVRKHKRRYAEYRIDRTLLTKIETNLRKHRTAA